MGGMQHIIGFEVAIDITRYLSSPTTFNQNLGVRNAPFSITS